MSELFTVISWKQIIISVGIDCVLSLSYMMMDLNYLRISVLMNFILRYACLFFH